MENASEVYLIFILYLIKGMLRVSKSCKTKIGSMELQSPKPTHLPHYKPWITKETKGRCYKENYLTLEVINISRLTI